MMSRGARSLIFLSRTEKRTKEVQELVEYLEANSCRVKVCVCDVGNEDQLTAAIKACRDELLPIKGCIQGAMVLQVSCNN